MADHWSRVSKTLWVLGLLSAVAVLAVADWGLTTTLLRVAVVVFEVAINRRFKFAETRRRRFVDVDGAKLASLPVGCCVKDFNTFLTL